MGHDLFPNDCFSHPGRVDYSDRQSWPLFITKSQNSEVIKIWNEDIFADPNVGPQLEFDKRELKDFRHFQNYFLQIKHPVDLRLEMSLIDMKRRKVLVSHTLRIDEYEDSSQVRESTKHLSTLELFKTYLIFQIDKRSVRVLNLVNMKESTLP